VVFVATKLLRGAWQAVFLETWQLFQRYGKSASLMMQCLLLSLLSQTFVTLMYVVLARALGIDMGASEFFVIVALIMLITLLPVSIGGLGAREISLVALLVVAGVAEQIAVTLSLVALVVVWLSVLPGVVLIFMNWTDVKQLQPAGPGSSHMKQSDK
jgi:hypothetical protein